MSPPVARAHRAASIRSAHFSPIMMQAALVLPETTVGMIEASATRKPQRPWTRSSGSTTALRAGFVRRAVGGRAEMRGPAGPPVPAAARGWRHSC